MSLFSSADIAAAVHSPVAAPRKRSRSKISPDHEGPANETKEPTPAAQEPDLDAVIAPEASAGSPEPEPEALPDMEIPPYDGLRVLWYAGKVLHSEPLRPEAVKVERRDRELKGKSMSEIKISYLTPRHGPQPVLIETVAGRVAWYKFEDVFAGDAVANKPRTTLAITMGFDGYDEYKTIVDILEDPKGDHALADFPEHARFYRDFRAFELHVWRKIWSTRDTTLKGIAMPKQADYKTCNVAPDEAWTSDYVRRICLARFVSDDAERGDAHYAPAIKLAIPKLRDHYQTGLYDLARNALPWAADSLAPGATVQAILHYRGFIVHSKRLVPSVDAHQVLIHQQQAPVAGPSFGAR